LLAAPGRGSRRCSAGGVTTQGPGLSPQFRRSPMRNRILAAYYPHHAREPVLNSTGIQGKMRNAIPILFTVAAGFAVAELAASTVYRSTPLNDPPMAYYLLGEAPWSPIAIPSAANPELNAPFMIEAWVQPIDDYNGSSAASGVLGRVAAYNYPLRSARVASPYRAETAFEAGTLTLLGLVLIIFGLIPPGWRPPLKFRGSDAGLSRARMFQVGGVSLRRRSEPELNSFSACYATTRANQEAALPGCRVPVAFRRPRTPSRAG